MMPYPEREPLAMGFGEAWDQIREETRRIRMPRECGACPKREVCFVCAAVCITETGAFDQVPRYVCRQTEETIDITWHRYQLDPQVGRSETDKDQKPSETEEKSESCKSRENC